MIHDVLPADHGAIVEVWEASVTATHHFLTPEDIAFFKPLVPDFLQQVELRCTKNSDGQITGFLGVLGSRIEMLFLHPDERGKGIGKLLLNHAIESMQATEVDVNEQNEHAVGFYLYAGFEPFARSATDPMGKPFPILHMRLRR